MNILHISLTNFMNESRVLKEARSSLKADSVEFIYIAALHEEPLSENEKIDDYIILKRFSLSSRALSKILFAQVLKYIEFFFRIFYVYRSKNIGLVTVHCLALLPIGFLLKSLLGAKLIYDAHELETETVDLSGFRKILAKGVERLFISAPSLILVVSDSIADWYATNYKIVRPTVILNTPKLQSVEKNNYFRKFFRLKSQQKIFLYQGNLGQGRGIELLIKAFSDRNDDNAVLILMGYGDLEHLAVKMSNISNIIFFHPAVPPAELLQYTAAADVGVALIENVCLSYFYCLPNKLFEYAMAGLPCIVSNGMEMQRVVEQADLGLVIDPNDEDSISSAIEQMVLTDVTLYQKKARYMVNDFSWETQEQKLLTSLNKLCLK